MRPLIGDEAVVNDDEEIRRRQQLVRIGLLLCFILALMDSGSQENNKQHDYGKSTVNKNVWTYVNRCIKLININMI